MSVDFADYSLRHVQNLPLVSIKYQLLLEVFCWNMKVYAQRRQHSQLDYNIISINCWGILIGILFIVHPQTANITIKIIILLFNHKAKVKWLAPQVFRFSITDRFKREVTSSDLWPESLLSLLCFSIQSDTSYWVMHIESDCWSMVCASHTKNTITYTELKKRQYYLYSYK